jgi:DNA-binding GntR family transcriptional regulator
MIPKTDVEMSLQKKSQFSPRPVLREQIKEYIINKILTGELCPGQHVVESMLARELHVSHAPVREAIRDLELMGFLVSEPFKGASVRLFTPDELEEVYTVRASLEALAARQAAAHITEENIQELRAILDEMMVAAKNQDRNLTSHLDIKFHETIWKISLNKLLLKFWQNLQLGQWTIITASRSKRSLVELAARHEELLDALITRDPELATKAMRDHIEKLEKPVNGSSK